MSVAPIQQAPIRVIILIKFLFERLGSLSCIINVSVNICTSLQDWMILAMVYDHRHPLHVHGGQARAAELPHHLRTMLPLPQQLDLPLQPSHRPHLKPADQSAAFPEDQGNIVRPQLLLLHPRYVLSRMLHLEVVFQLMEKQHHW